MGMEQKTSALIGEPVEKTTIVSPRGTGKKMFTTGMATTLGGVVGGLAADRKTKISATGLDNLKGSHIVLALSPTRLTFFAMKRGLLSNSPGELLAEIPRAEIQAFTIGGGVMTAEVEITLTDGSVVSLETPKAHKGKTKGLAEAMGFRD